MIAIQDGRVFSIYVWGGHHIKLTCGNADHIYILRVSPYDLIELPYREHLEENLLENAPDWPSWARLKSTRSRAHLSSVKNDCNDILITFKQNKKDKLSFIFSI